MIPWLKFGLGMFLILVPMLWLAFFSYYRSRRGYVLEWCIRDAVHHSIGIAMLVVMLIEGIAVILHMP